MRIKLFTPIILLSLCFCCESFAAGYSSGNDVTANHSQTVWAGMVSYKNMKPEDLNEFFGDHDKSLITATTKAELLAFKKNQQIINGIERVNFYSYLAKENSLLNSAVFKETYAQVREIYLRSPNKSAVALNSSEGVSSKSSISWNGDNGGSSMSSGDSSTTTFAVTTCDENMRRNGFEIGCMHGNGKARISGITFDFRNWGVSGIDDAVTKVGNKVLPVTWKYQGGIYTITHTSQTTSVSFSIKNDDISVIDAKGLVSLSHQESNGRVGLTQQKLHRYLDILFHERLIEGAVVKDQNGKYEHDKSSFLIAMMSIFVTYIAENPDETAKAITSIASKPDSYWDKALWGKGQNVSKVAW